jgi:tetratricopeptide (TPR) repeat protein
MRMTERSRQHGIWITKKQLIIFFILILFGMQGCKTLSYDTGAEWFKIGKASLDSEGYKDAVVAFDKAIDHNPQYAEAYYYRGLAHGSRGNDEQAVNDIKIAARLDFKLAQEFLKKRRIEW